MAVEIPRLKRLAPVEVGSSGRITADAPDVSKALGQQQEAVEGLTEQGIKYFEKVEKDTIHTESMAGSNDFESWYREQIEGDGTTDNPGLQHMQGDTSEAYADLDRRADAKFEEISGRGGKYSEKVKSYVKAAMSEKYSQLHNMRLTVAGNQQDRYTKDVFASNLKLGGLSLQESNSRVVPGDKESFNDVNKNISNIRDTYILHASKYGGAVQDDENGSFELTEKDGSVSRWNVNESVLLDIKKDLSENMYQSVDNALNARKLDVASAIYNNYKGMIDPKRDGELQKMFTSVKKEKEAYKYLAQIYADPKKKNSIIDGIADAETKLETKKLWDEDQRYKENEKTRRAGDAYGRAHILTTEKKYGSLQQLENDQEMRPLLDVMTPPQRSAIMNIVVKPKVSDPLVRQQMFDLMKDTDRFAALSGAEFDQATDGLSQADYNFYRGALKQLTVETTPAERAKVRSGLTEFQRIYEGSGLVKKPQGKETKSSIAKRTQHETDFSRLFIGAAPNLSSSEVTEAAQLFINRAVILDKNENRGGFMGIGAEPIQTVPSLPTIRKQGTSPSAGKKETPKVTGSKKYNDMSDSERKRTREAYKAAFPSKKANVSDIQKWLDEGK